MENKLQESHIVIEPKGSYFDVDKDGFLINPASPEKIQERWKEVISDVVEAYKSEYGDALKQVYIRGSVAKGEAIDHISDLDSYAYIDIPKEEIKWEWVRRAEETLVQKYPFALGIEFNPKNQAAASDDVILLNQSLCVYGESLDIPKLKPGKEMARHAPWIERDINKMHSFFEKEHSEEEIKTKCVWIMRDFLRAGFEITMERSQKYTRDLYLCYQSFSHYYPEREPEIAEVLNYALNPTADTKAIKGIVDNFGKWLSEESKKYF